jgi:hypothetical protein
LARRGGRRDHFAQPDVQLVSHEFTHRVVANFRAADDGQHMIAFVSLQHQPFGPDGLERLSRRRVRRAIRFGTVRQQTADKTRPGRLQFAQPALFDDRVFDFGRFDLRLLITQLHLVGVAHADSLLFQIEFQPLAPCRCGIGRCAEHRRLPFGDNSPHIQSGECGFARMHFCFRSRGLRSCRSRLARAGKFDAQCLAMQTIRFAARRQPNHGHTILECCLAAVKFHLKRALASDFDPRRRGRL